MAINPATDVGNPPVNDIALLLQYIFLRWKVCRLQNVFESVLKHKAK